jgi:type 1 fimbria pilin
MHKNVKAKSLCTALGMVFAATAWAEAPTQDMTVAGTIKAPTCEVDIAGGEGGGTINHGDISPTLIKAGTTFHELEPVTLDWTISCDAQTYLTYQVVDNEVASANKRAWADFAFGLGAINGDGKLGYYIMHAKSLSVDGNVAYHGSQARPGDLKYLSTLSGYSYDYVRNLAGWSFGWAQLNNTGTSPLKPGSEFTMSMEIRTYLSGAADMNGGVTTTVPLQGHTTFSFAFAL